MCVGMQGGRTAVFGGAVPVRPIEWAGQLDGETESSAEVELRVALPPVALSDQAWSSLEGGDAVLLGVGQVTSASAGAVLVSTSGWAVADVRVEADSPTVCCARVVRWRMESWQRDAEAACVMLGRSRVSVRALVGLAEGEILDVAKPDGFVELWRGGRARWRGELVRVDDEVAVRLLEAIDVGEGRP